MPPPPPLPTHYYYLLINDILSVLINQDCKTLCIVIRVDLSTRWTFNPTERRWQTPCTYTAVIRPLNVYLACYCTNLSWVPIFYTAYLEKWFIENNVKKNANIMIRDDLSTTWKFCPTVQWWQTPCTDTAVIMPLNVYLACYCTNLFQISPIHAAHLEEWFKEKDVKKMQIQKLLVR